MNLRRIHPASPLQLGIQTMPKALLVLRDYPLILVMTLVFLFGLALATSSTGVVGGGGDDSGSGMGGTGKSGTPGDSGFGGTGGPSPYLGSSSNTSNEANSDARADDSNAQPQNLADWPAPWLPRETETARIPEEIAPLIEIQRNPLRNPLSAPTNVLSAPDMLIPQGMQTDGALQTADSSLTPLRIIEQDSSQLPSHLRQSLDAAHSGETMLEAAPVEIRLQIPEIAAPDPMNIPVLRKPETAVPDAVDNDAVNNNAVNNIAENSSEELPEIVTETPTNDGRSEARDAIERIQRPELPPFQRVRPAVDRGPVQSSARPQPMRI